MRRLTRRAAEGRPGRVLVVLPFHSLVNEKVTDLQRRLAPLYRKRGRGAREAPAVAVRGFAGPEAEGTPLAKPLGCPGQEVVAVTTIEKASIAVRGWGGGGHGGGEGGLGRGGTHSTHARHHLVFAFYRHLPGRGCVF